jgi:hypothetical protein
MVEANERLMFSTFAYSDSVMQSASHVHFSGSFIRGTRVTSEDRGDKAAAGGDRWRMANEAESFDRMGRKWHSRASSALYAN